MINFKINLRVFLFANGNRHVRSNNDRDINGNWSESGGNNDHNKHFLFSIPFNLLSYKWHLNHLHEHYVTTNIPQLTIVGWAL